MDRLEAMTLLVASVEEGSFSQAGRRLGIPLPTVSRKVADLESHLKAKLLVRSTRKLTLTEAGSAYVATCKRILDEIAEAEAQAAGEYTVPRGDLTLTAPVVFGRLHVVPVVNAFIAQYPEINVKMTLSDRNVSIVDEHIDLAVRIGKLPDSSLMASKLGDIRKVVCGSPAYFAAHGTPKTPGDLASHQCVTFSAMASGPTWIFKTSGKAETPIVPQCRLYINTAEAAIDSAIRGVGVTNVLSYQVAQAVLEKKLQIVLEDYEPIPFPVHIVHARGALIPLKMRRFLEFAVPRIRKSVLTVQEDLASNAANNDRSRKR